MPQNFCLLENFLKNLSINYESFFGKLVKSSGRKNGPEFFIFFMTLVVRLLKLGLGDFSLKSSLSAKPVQEKNITTMSFSLVLMIFHMSVNS